MSPAAPLRPHRDIVERRFGRVIVATDEKLTRAQMKKIAREAKQAFASDAFEQGRGAHGPKRTITVGVFSDKSYAEFTGDTHKATFGQQVDKNTLLLRDGIVHGKDPGDLAVLAHELGHLQDERLAGKRAGHVPTFLREGKAVLLGNRFVARQGKDNPHVKESAQALARYTAHDAEQMFAHFRGDPSGEIRRGRGARDERLGALYVEFLRTRFAGGTPNALARLARVTRDVGRGASFADAFAKRFGASAATAERAFVAFLRDTQGDARARLGGTNYGDALFGPNAG